MEALAKKREKWFDYIIFYLKLLAMHPLDFSLLPTRLRFLRYPLNFFFYAFWHFIILHLAYVQDVSVYLNLDQTLDDIISYVMNGSIYTYGYFIELYMVFNCTKLLKLFDFMRINFRERSAKALKQAFKLPMFAGLTYVSIDESVEIGKKYCLFWIYCCLAGTLSWLLYPLFKCCKILPLKSWYPMDVSYFPAYQLAYLFQIFGQIFVGAGYGIVGGINIVMIAMLCGQYDILYASLKNLATAVSLDDSQQVVEFRKKQHNFNFEEEELNQYFVSTEKFDDPAGSDEVLSAADALKDCVEHHQMILDFMVLVEDYFTWFVLPKILYAALLVCLIAYVFSTLDEFSPIKVANLLMYLMLASSELLLFNFNAELLKQHSVRAGDALMRSHWEESNLKDRQSMLIILANAAKPTRLTAGKFLVLNIDQFRTAMGTAFSYYTLLKKMKEKSQAL